MQTSFELYRALVSINVTEDRAKAVVVALEADMTNHLATKTDITELKAKFNELRIATKADINELKAELNELKAATKAELNELELRLTIRMALMLSTAVGIGLALAKLLF
ncbi:hypothetical protein AKN87_07120 [Thiopseudomonas alkaliphila]|uniref:hypothetical protein n=1 Tax=Thiopseudomonas alkaliphila TaxID=1697053 RepID=UPI00069F35C9|nr:hypothetical protein [Thiopseudomonas alkaliphila]AKX44891.1 hypothetical protein AKN87_07120 [Thiopseudomonas alkaliphila]